MLENLVVRTRGENHQGTLTPFLLNPLISVLVGTRDYYRRFGYERLGPYMGRPLK